VSSTPTAGSAGTIAVEQTVQPTGPDDGLPWVAWARTDTSSATSTATQVVARVRGADLVVALVPDQRVDLLGWYGAVDHRTLVWAQTGAHQLQTLYAVPFGTDGSVAAAAAPLTVPGQPPLAAGRAFAVDGAGPALWLADNSPGVTPTGELVAVADDLGTVSTEIFDDTDGPAVVVTRDHVAVATTAGIEVEERAVGHGRRLVRVCDPPRDVVPSDDGHVIAFVCTDGRVDLLRFDDGRGLVQNLPVVSGSSDLRIRAWWDHDGGLHVSTSTAILPDPEASTSSFDLATDTWVPGENGVLSRVFTWGAPTVRIASAAPGSLATGDVGRVVIESTTALDLGPTTGSVAVRQTASTPRVPIATTHGAVGIPWTARIVHPRPTDPSVQDVGVTVDGVERLVGLADRPRALKVVGWTGRDRRTLVVASLLDDEDDADLFRIDVDASGTQRGGPVRLTLPSPRGRHPVTGRGFLTPSSRLVVVQHSGRRSEPDSSTVLRFSAALSTATSEHVPALTGLACFNCTVFLAATSEAVLEYSWPEVESGGPIVITVTGRHGIGRVPVPACTSTTAEPRLTLSPDGRTAALTCGAGEVDLLDLGALSRRRDGLARVPLPSATASAISSWWDPRGRLHVTTTALDPRIGTSQPLRSEQMTTWDYRPESRDASRAWSKASPPLVLARAYSTDGWTARLVPRGSGEIAAYTWVSDTDPRVLLDTVDDPTQVLAIR
jgi:hypothetical protein